VAEHVESKAAADRLTALGVDYAQGYYYAAPALVQEGAQLRSSRSPNLQRA
jgi:EAL domain-containing protein (putative c-di-GMP-specific phosphodiesterase class I)